MHTRRATVITLDMSDEIIVRYKGITMRILADDDNEKPGEGSAYWLDVETSNEVTATFTGSPDPEHTRAMSNETRMGNVGMHNLTIFPDRAKF